VDELWHAHILCSPSYFGYGYNSSHFSITAVPSLFACRTETFAPGGKYVHHYPHFDKPRDYHEPGFHATLACYKEVWSTLQIVSNVDCPLRALL
jgi:hypothetical protein